MTSPLERTGRRIVAGTWGCAGITMAASAANAALTYGALGDNRVLGLATGVAVDIGLCVALIGDRQLYAHGLSSNWGRGLRITTAVMSLILNVGISLRDGHYFAALLHSFLPVLLIVLTEYGQDILLKLGALAREEQAQRPRPAPVPIGEPLPQLHRPLATPPVSPAPVPTVRPIPDPQRQEQPAWTPIPASTGPRSSTTTADTSAPGSPASSGRSLSLRGGSSPSTAASAARGSDRTPDQPGNDDLVDRVRKLIHESDGRAPGRRAIAKQLGVSEHAARAALDLVAATTGSVLNGHGTKPKPPTSGGAR